LFFSHKSAPEFDTVPVSSVVWDFRLKVKIKFSLWPSLTEESK